MTSEIAATTDGRITALRCPVPAGRAPQVRNIAALYLPSKIADHRATEAALPRLRSVAGRMTGLDQTQPASGSPSQ
jgi:hypothetical protein